ncbi:His-Xaa-Ser system radical SAM maturase HxsB [Kordiimonas aestuarii]|uniref:His-Xaa-Ser system radical SAM maturase HxsB n=1 Tax=Kordiimonas aestuarii TaxID=1005925 RepID=UPI0021CE2C21|nr:His-Xaa-Ser system radical SAM maturase HxsB [Kordiimonas aestuarii]
MIPLRFKDTSRGDRDLIFVDDGGQSFLASQSFLNRYVFQNLNENDVDFLRAEGFAGCSNTGQPSVANAYRFAQRHHLPNTIDYFILVPTLRCNLACSYCQVSRVAENARGFDWTDQIADDAIKLICTTGAPTVKLEFQGGEPTLRLDLIKRVIDSVEKTGRNVEAVICTNLGELSSDLRTLLGRGNVYISTSFDGSEKKHTVQRTGSAEATARTLKNIKDVIENFGQSRVSALPTIDANSPPDPDTLIDEYLALGMNSIYLRPINFQGFARKKHDAARTGQERWFDYYLAVVRRMIERNFHEGKALEEFYMAHCLRRIFRPRANGHADLRNPNPLGLDYFVIDHDGRLFPSDEARMIDRTGDVDMSIGDVHSGLDGSKVLALSELALNDFDPDCIHCAYQPFCGSDPIDSISRYGRTDQPRHDQYFCQQQTMIFDFLFEMLAQPTAEQAYTLALWLGLPAIPDTFLKVHHD